MKLRTLALVAGCLCAALLVVLAFPKRLYAPSWPRCEPCQLSTMPQHAMRAWVDPYIRPQGGSVQWVQVYTSAAGMAPMKWVGNTEGYYFSVDTETHAAMPSPGQSWVTFWTCWQECANGTQCGWTDWQTLDVVNY